MSNPALWTLQVKEQKKFMLPFQKECPGCGMETQFKFSHFSQSKGHKFAVFYCSMPGCYEEHRSPIGSRQ